MTPNHLRTPPLLAGVACLAISATVPALDGGQQLLDRQQDADALRRDRRIDEFFLPDSAPAAETPVAGAGVETPCFVVSKLVLDGADALLSPAQQRDIVREYNGRCLGMTSIRALQARLTHLLVEQGNVTSRVLLPGQDISGGTLRLQLVAGRIEAYEATSLQPRTLEAAFPGRPGAVLHLPALEQGIENLNRLPGMGATLGILPGTADGTSRVHVQQADGRPWQLQANLNAGGIEDEADTLGRVAFTLGNAAGFAERITIAATSKLDDHRLDASRGSSIDIDVPHGYWQFALSQDAQDYRDVVQGVLTTFRSTGESRNTRLQAGRVLYRRGHSRLAITLLAGEAESENRIDDTTLEVSSYTLRTLGLRMEHSALHAGAQWTTWLTAEQGDAAGPATHPLGGTPIADTLATRGQLYLRRTRPWDNGQTASIQSVTAQYSTSRLFPLQQMSLLTDSAVRGFTDTSASGSTALAVRAELNHGWQHASARLPGSLQSFIGMDVGWIGNDNSVASATRAASISVGLLWYGDNCQWRVVASDPLGGISTIGPTSPVLATTLVWTY